MNTSLTQGRSAAAEFSRGREGRKNWRGTFGWEGILGGGGVAWEEVQGVGRTGWSPQEVRDHPWGRWQSSACQAGGTVPGREPWGPGEGEQVNPEASDRGWWPGKGEPAGVTPESAGNLGGSMLEFVESGGLQEHVRPGEHSPDPRAQPWAGRGAASLKVAGRVWVQPQGEGSTKRDAAAPVAVEVGFRSGRCSLRPAPPGGCHSP